MQNKYSKKQLEELYNCEIFKDSGFDSSYLFWVAHGLPFTEDGEVNLFTYADGWGLDELHENIREAIREHCIVFDGYTISNLMKNKREQFLQNLETGCCEKLTKNCKMDCKTCPCKSCDKRLDCDGDNPMFGCDG